MNSVFDTPSRIALRRAIEGERETTLQRASHAPAGAAAHAGSPLPAIVDAVDAVYVINLPSREDRRAEMAEQLARANLDFAHPRVRLFAAHRPDDRGPFPSVGARGCFMSHLGVLEDARERGLGRILILEDDADFAPDFFDARIGRAIVAGLRDCDILYLGHKVMGECAPEGDSKGPLSRVPPSTGVMLAHAMVMNRRAVIGAAAYLEAMLQRPAGDPQGGPMHVDGAYSWFRSDHPEIVTMSTKAMCVVQRSSRTDIGDNDWREHIPGIGLLRRMRNKLRYLGS